MTTMITEVYDARGERARAHRLTGAEMRKVIDAWKAPYTRVAGWLGLSADGLHKLMRGEREISAQTWMLFDNLAKGFELQAAAWTEEEQRHPDSKVVPGQAPRAGEARRTQAGRALSPLFWIAATSAVAAVLGLDLFHCPSMPVSKA